MSVILKVHYVCIVNEDCSFFRAVFFIFKNGYQTSQRGTGNAEAWFVY